MSQIATDYIRHHHLALVALFFALTGGVAWATHPGGTDTISSGDIINGEVKNDDLGGNAVGTAKISDRSVKNNDLSLGASSSNTIADGGIQGVDVKNGTLTGTQVDESTLLNDNSLTDEDLAPEAQFNDAAAGGDLTGTYPSPAIEAGAVGPEELAPVPSARVFNVANDGCTGGQTIAHDTQTSLQFASEAFDEGGLHAGGNGFPDNCTAAANTKLTVPRAGLYQVSAGILWPANAAGKRTLVIHLSRGVHLAQEEYDAAAVGATLQSASTLERLEEGEFVEARVVQTSGAELEVDWDAGGDPRSYLAMAWLGP